MNGREGIDVVMNGIGAKEVDRKISDEAKVKLREIENSLQNVDMLEDLTAEIIEPKTKFVLSEEVEARQRELAEKYPQLEKKYKLPNQCYSIPRKKNRSTIVNG
jgi:division protein CdvB (Snf7/Vps24/ESCRT-III family)